MVQKVVAKPPEDEAQTGRFQRLTDESETLETAETETHAPIPSSMVSMRF